VPDYKNKSLTIKIQVPSTQLECFRYELCNLTDLLLTVYFFREVFSSYSKPSRGTVRIWGISAVGNNSLFIGLSFCSYRPFAPEYVQINKHFVLR